MLQHHYFFAGIYAYKAVTTFSMQGLKFAGNFARTLG